MIPRATTLADLPRCAAQRFGDKTALFTGDGELGFAQLERRIAALAVRLAQRGVAPADRVVLHLPNTWQWIVAYYAIARLGAVVVPANILLVGEEIRFIADDCDAMAVITSDDRVDALRNGARGQRYRHYVAAGDLCIDLDIEVSTTTPVAAPAIAPTTVSTIGYTSGTTGHMKGAVLSHGAVVLNTAMTANMHVRTAADIVVTALPCSHVYGNVIMNGAFLCGYGLVLMERYDADLALEAIERHRATLFEGVPTMYYYLLGSQSLGRRRLGSLTRATVGGQTMPLPQMKEAQQRLGCPLLELWGMTEIAGLGTTHPAYAPETLGSVGQPLPFSDCRIADLRDPSRALPPGEEGELLFRGPTVMQGYHNQPQATREATLPGNWLRTGDIAYRDAAGYVFIVDRVKDMIITAGYNIYPSEVERVLAAHPDVQMVAVGAIPDEAKGELAHAYVVVKQSASLDEGSLIAYCRTHLAAYKVPKSIRFVADLPKTSTGKIIRRALHKLNA